MACEVFLSTLYDVYKVELQDVGRMNNWELISEEAGGTNNPKNDCNQLPIIVDEIFTPLNPCLSCQHLSLLFTLKWKI